MIPCDTAGYEKPKEKTPVGEKAGNVSPEPMQCHDPSGVKRTSSYKIIMIYEGLFFAGVKCWFTFWILADPEASQVLEGICRAF